ncbi:SDR family oxidoreductase [Streptomyces sp. NPDC092369]|uniref:SDR family oxidoreductase n=1 Tax=Streptomyces sp. NPDC092369 TaxID=3366015 RepID=UPI0037F12E7D
MRVFVTGATGFIGSALVHELLGAGHRVTGLARSERSAAALVDAGAEVLHGSLDDLDSLAKGAASADAVAHLAFIHDFSDFEASCAADLRAIETIGAALEGSGKPFAIASGTAGLRPGQLVTEDYTPQGEWFGTPRLRSETTALGLADHGVRSSSVRLAPTVHGVGDHGFVHLLIEIARAKGFSAYVGDGTNRWPAVHRLDAARLFRLTLEGAPAGTRVHAIAEEGIAFRAIAETIGRRLDLPTEAVSSEEAAAHFGWIGPIAALDMPASNELTRERLGWQPTEPGLIADLEAGHYFG